MFGSFRSVYQNMVVPLGSPQPVFSFSPLEAIPDEHDDQPKPGLALSTFGTLGLPSIAFGAATLSNIYNSNELLTTDAPVRIVRLALRYGIRAFDSSPYYGTSEIVLGSVLKTLEPEFPRSSYTLMTKCGRYGTPKAAFDYSPATIRASIERSLARLHTSYLDVVYLHDVEFVSENVTPRLEGSHDGALGAELAKYGLTEGEEAKVWGEGDQKILDAVAELRKMQDEGLIKHIGISGYPLPTLLRLALLVLHTAPYKPLDAILSYSHTNLQNASLVTFAPALQQRARVAQLLAASPFNMGLLTPAPPPWHPAPPPMTAAVAQARAVCAPREGGLPAVALRFAYREAEQHQWPMVVGLSSLKEVHEAVRVWRAVKGESEAEAAANVKSEQEVRTLFEDAGVLDWSWRSPPLESTVPS